MYIPVGLAHVCVVTESMTITRARIEVHIPRKRRGSCDSHDKVNTYIHPDPYTSTGRVYNMAMMSYRPSRGFMTQLCKLFCDMLGLMVSIYVYMYIVLYMYTKDLECAQKNIHMQCVDR